MLGLHKRGRRAGERGELLMVSGFTDDLPIQKGNNRFDDNWELSAQRALTVTRALIEEGMPPTMVFAAAFGAQQPVVANTDNASRSQNRRVEMAPVDERVGDMVQSTLSKLHRAIEAAIRKDHPQLGEPAETASAIVAAYLGSRVLAKSGSKLEMISATRDQCLRLLN